MFPAVHELDWLVVQNAVAYVNQHPTLVITVYFLAEVLIYAFGITLFVLWHQKQPASQHQGNKKAVLMAVMSVFIALAVKSLIVFFFSRARPFISHPELASLPLKVDPSSFPSGHSLVAFAIAWSLLYSKAHRLGIVLLICAVLVGAARIATGVHYPTDVLAAAIIGLLAALYIHREASSLKRYLPNQ